MRDREEITGELESIWMDRDHSDGGGYFERPDHMPAILEVLLDIRDLLTPRYVYNEKAVAPKDMITKL